jgi:hypothetical protein
LPRPSPFDTADEASDVDEFDLRFDLLRRFGDLRDLVEPLSITATRPHSADQQNG